MSEFSAGLSVLPIKPDTNIRKLNGLLILYYQMFLMGKLVYLLAKLKVANQFY